MELAGLAGDPPGACLLLTREGVWGRGVWRDCVGMGKVGVIHHSGARLLLTEDGMKRDREGRRR